MGKILGAVIAFIVIAILVFYLLVLVTAWV